MTRFNVLTLPAVFSLLSVACGYDNGDRQSVDSNAQTPGVSDYIDTDAVLTDLPTGAGLFVEYAAGGTWKVQTTCDLSASKSDCLWDIYAYTPVGVGIVSAQALDLESDDLLTIKSDGELTLYTTTGGDIDGVTFATTPGEPITFEFFLDGVWRPEDYFFYASRGALVSGVASTAIKLTPTVP